MTGSLGRAARWVGRLMLFCLLLLPRAVRRLVAADLVGGLLLLAVDLVVLTFLAAFVQQA